MLVNRRIRIVKDKITRVKRALQGDGQILTQLGQEVGPSDIIGRSIISGGFRSVDLAGALGVSPKEVKKYLQRPLGKVIYKGELLAYKGAGIFSDKKIVTAPSDGILELLNEENGLLKLKIVPQQLDLPAAVFGIVESVDHIKKEIFIKTQVTCISGLAGSGESKEGYLKVLGDRGNLIDKNRILPQLRDRILVAGGLIYKEALTQATSFGVSGIITGGINASDFKSMAGGHIFRRPGEDGDVGIGLLVTEGFGSIPMGADIFEYLSGYNEGFAILEGNRQILTLPSIDPDCITKIKKVKLPVDFSPIASEVDAVEVEVGQRVRIISSSYMGEQGQIMAVDKVSSKLPSEVITYMITVATKSRKLRVPYTNVEVIE